MHKDSCGIKDGVDIPANQGLDWCIERAARSRKCSMMLTERVRDGGTAEGFNETGGRQGVMRAARSPGPTCSGQTDRQSDTCTTQQMETHGGPRGMDDIPTATALDRRTEG